MNSKERSSGDLVASFHYLCHMDPFVRLTLLTEQVYSSTNSAFAKGCMMREIGTESADCQNVVLVC